jgi:hypothetical protein
LARYFDLVLGRNPVVGFVVYGKLKSCVRLYFGSGQPFWEKGLTDQGKFKDSKARFTDVDQLDVESLESWLTKSQEIQLDYKNIVRRKGVLERLK